MTDAPPAEQPSPAATGDTSTTSGIWDALSRFQADLPEIVTDQVGKAEKEGRTLYTWKYADLAQVSRVILPRLGKLGCAWVTVPRSTDRGVVLEYRLRHVATGEEILGEWFIGTGDPQQLGSRITYARRYALLAITGVFPAGEDDDGTKGGTQSPQRERAEQATLRERPAQQRASQRRGGAAAETAPPAPAEDQGVPGPQTRAVEQQALEASVRRAEARAASAAEPAQAGPKPTVPSVDQLASVHEFLTGDEVFPTAQLAAASKLFGEVQQASKTGWRHLGSGPSLVDVWESRLVRALAGCTSVDGVRRIEAMIQTAGMQGPAHPKLTTALIDAYERYGESPIGTPDPAN